MSDPAPVVGVLAASPAELTLMQQAAAILEKLEIPHEVRVMSSPRNPDLVDEYARTAFERGLKAVVCTTGISGHLAAAVAARTIVPVIGVPVATEQMGGENRLQHEMHHEAAEGVLVKFAEIDGAHGPSGLGEGLVRRFVAEGAAV